MLVFATPRPTKSDNIHELEENEHNLSVKVSEMGGDADTFQQTFSARVRRREKVHNNCSKQAIKNCAWKRFKNLKELFKSLLSFGTFIEMFYLHGEFVL